jgi:hypothetical protein
MLHTSSPPPKKLLSASDFHETEAIKALIFHSLLGAASGVVMGCDKTQLPSPSSSAHPSSVASKGSFLFEPLKGEEYVDVVVAVGGIPDPTDKDPLFASIGVALAGLGDACLPLYTTRVWGVSEQCKTPYFAIHATGSCAAASRRR